MKISDNDFNLVLDFIEKNTGIDLPQTNFRNVKNFLADRLTELALTTGRYLELLKNQNREYDEFINVITINETYFFREEKHFTILCNRILPELFSRELPLLNIWSAACSTGEEALSLAALLNKLQPGNTGKSFMIYATDICPYVLEFFRQGKYRKNSFRQDGRQYKHLLDEIGRQEGDTWLPSSEIMRQIRISQLNLHSNVNDDFPKFFNIIFLRNTILYMKIETRLRLIDNISQRLVEDGYLFLSMSETALISHPQLKLIEQDKIFYFRKQTQPAENRESPVKVIKLKSTLKDRLPVTRKPFGEPMSQPALEIKKFSSPVITGTNPAGYSEKTTPDEQIRRQLLETITLINTGKPELARDLLCSIEREMTQPELLAYLHGYLDMVTGRSASALSHFRQALIINHTFWLPRFYIAKLLSTEEPAMAKQEFMICQQQIRSYLRQAKRDYQFLLEEFNAGYFENMCSRWLEHYHQKE